jgi:hypothetical protein
MTEKMKEVKNVVDVETKEEEVKDVENETENEEFMTVKVPKAKGYAMLANGEASEVETERPENEKKEKKGILSRIKNSRVAKGIGIGAAVVGGVAVAFVAGRNSNNSDEVTFEDVPPQGLPDNYDNYQTYDQVDVETKEEEV